MDLRLIGAIIGFFVGIFLGGSMGVAAGGGAVNGAYVFGPICAIIGFLLGRRKNEFRKNEITDTKDIEGKDTIETEYVDSLEENLTELANKAEGLFSSFVRLLCSIWNLQMQVLINVGAMPYFKSKPWFFVVIGILLLAVLLPIGVVFCLTAFAAMSKEVKEEDNFVVLKKQQA